MSYALAFFAFLIAAPAAAAPVSIMDGTGADWSDTEKAMLIKLADKDKSPDPYATQARNLRRVNPQPGRYAWCGDMNVVTRAGRYDGFRPFYITMDTNTGKRDSSFITSVKPREMDDLALKLLREGQAKAGC